MEFEGACVSQHADDVIFACIIAAGVWQHWIRLEMQPDVLVSLLTMSVEPSDSSYMPSLLTVSAGGSVQSLRELRTVTVEPNDRCVVLLDNLTQVAFRLAYLLTYLLAYLNLGRPLCRVYF